VESRRLSWLLSCRPNRPLSLLWRPASTSPFSLHLTCCPLHPSWRSVSGSWASLSRQRTSISPLPPISASIPRPPPLRRGLFFPVLVPPPLPSWLRRPSPAAPWTSPPLLMLGCPPASCVCAFRCERPPPTAAPAAQWAVPAPRVRTVPAAPPVI